MDERLNEAIKIAEHIREFVRGKLCPIEEARDQKREL